MCPFRQRTRRDGDPFSGRHVEVEGADDLGGGSGADLVADTGVDLGAERRGLDPHLVRASTQDQSLVGWSISFDANRCDTFADTPVGSDALSRPLGGQDQEHAERPADADHEARIVGGLRPVPFVAEQVLDLVDDAAHRPELQRPPRGDLAGDAFVGAQVAGQGLEPFGWTSITQSREARCRDKSGTLAPDLGNPRSGFNALSPARCRAVISLNLTLGHCKGRQTTIDDLPPRCD